MSNPIEHFEVVLRKHSSKRLLALYNGNKQQNKPKCRPQDVLSSVSAQLKAIQVADSVNNRSARKDLQKHQKSTFLCVNKLPVYEEPPKQQTNTYFDTQFVSNTQLINIIEDAELKDEQRDISQAFETSFTNMDRLTEISESTSVPHTHHETHSGMDTDKFIEKSHTGYCKDQYIENKDTTYCKNTNECDTDKYVINKDSVGTAKSTHQIIKNNVTEVDSKYSKVNDGSHEISITGEKTAAHRGIIKQTIKDKVRNKNYNMTSDSQICNDSDTKEENTVENETDDLKDEKIKKDIKQLLNECIEFDFNTETNTTERSPSPVFINKKLNDKSKSPSPLVYNLEAFEKFENFALSIIEHNDFEKLKRVINSQILERELHVKTDRDVELESKSVPLSPVLKIKTIQHNIQNAPQKNLHTEITVDNQCYPTFSPIENQSPITSQILQENYRNKSPKKHFDDKQKTINNTNLDKDLVAKAIDESKVSLFDDEILFSSDEEDIHKEYKDLPFTCALETSFCNQSDVLDRSMYVGFQTASNRSIQICKDSFDKAKSLLSDVNNDKTTVTDLVNICDGIRNIDKMEVQEVEINKENKNLAETNNRVGPGPESEDKYSIVEQTRCRDVKEFVNIYNKEISMNKGLIHATEDSNYIKETIENNNNFGGFITASRKRINVSDKALELSNKVFHDIDFDVKYDTYSDIVTKDTILKANFVNKDLNDVNKKMNEVVIQDTNIKNNLEVPNADAAGMKDECSDESIHNINDAIIIQEFENIEMSLEEDKEINKCGDFAGFKTASNKNIVISDDALAKTKNIFKDVDLYEERDENYCKDHNSEIKSPETFDKEDVNKDDHIPSNSFNGFKTANNKDIKISKKALAKTEHIFKDIDNVQLIENSDVITKTGANINQKNVYPNIEDFNEPSTSKENFSGFKTGNNKNINVSEACLAKVKDIFKNIDSNEEEHKDDFKHGSISKVSFPGFKTGNDTKIHISNTSLAKVKGIFKDIDILNIELSTKGDTIENDKTEDFPKAMPNNYQFQGFTTASNKQVTISKEALTKTKNIFKDIGTDGNYNIEAEKLVLNNKNKGVSSLETACASKNCDDALIDDKFDKSAASIFKGFQTASKKAVTISEEALARSRRIFKDLEDQNHIVNTNFAEVLNGTEMAKCNKIFNNKNGVRIENNTKFKGFQTGSHKVIDVTEKALIDSRKLLEGHTTSENKVGISEQAIEKFRTISQDLVNVDERDTNVNKETNKTIDFGFKTANNKKIKVSEDALVKSKNIFKDSDIVYKGDDINRDISDKDAIIDNRIETPNVEDFSNIIDTQVLNNFEDTLYTEDFKKTPIVSKRSGSPILSCPKAKKRKKFETPYSQKPVKNIITHDMTVKNTSKIQFDTNYKKHKTLKLKDLLLYTDADAKIDPYLTKFTFDNLLQFEFNNTRNDLAYTNMTVNLLKDLFLETVNAKLVPEGWIDNHIRLLIWKLISYEIRFSKSNVVCNTTNILNQLKYRYDRELYNAQRPALRKILERDDISTKTIVLCVVQIYENDARVDSVTNLTSNIELLLTDGWYCIKACIDKMMGKLVYDQKIVVGTKIVTNGAELLNCDQGMAPWEDTSSVRLKLFGNSTRRARWDARLGYHGNAAILTRLSTVNIDGGKVSNLRVLVTRVYPSLYVEKFEDGSTVTRSERLEHFHQMKYETDRQIMMEKLYEEVEKEFSDQESQDSESCSDPGSKRTCLDSGTQIAKVMRKSNDPAEFRAQLTSSQSILLVHHVETRREKLLQDVQARIREKVEKSGMCITRNVVPVKKIRVVGVEERGDAVVVTKGVMSIWKPNEHILEIIKEGAWIDVMNVVPTAVRYSEIQISAGRQSVFSQSRRTEPDKFKPYTNLLKRKCFTIKDLAHNPTISTDYNEIDTVGLVFLIDPSNREFESTKQLFQNVYITDGEKNIICVNFWGGLVKFGYENVLDTGQIVVCGNLQKRAGNTGRNIPQYRVTEFSYFTKMPKNDCARMILEELNKVFLCLDRRKFCDDCVKLKNNYSVMNKYKNENISPYRSNNSDYNISKNKRFIDSPLMIKNNYNLNASDFESTFKQTHAQDPSKEILLRKQRVNEKISKLKMYGEPPPLSPITILNKSKNAFNSYKSPLLSESGVSNDKPSIPNLKSDGCTDVASNQNTPQKKVVLNDAGQSPVLLNRTYVKSVNPVKLDFNQNNDSVTDHFAEEFDCSPPLSLD